MPVTLDLVSPEVLPKEEWMEKGHRRGLFEELRLTDDQKEAVIYRKVESLNSEVSDTFHPPDTIWHEQFTGMPQSLIQAGLSPRVFVSREGESQGSVQIEDGLIMTFNGVCAGPRSMDDRGRIISMEEAEEIQELSGEEEPSVWNLWEFRLVSLIRTDGPNRKESLLDSAEDKQNKSETRLVDMITNAFAAVGAGAQNQSLNINTMAQNPKDASDEMVKMLAGMHPDKREALFQMAEIESEDGNAEPLVNAADAEKTSFKKE
jgi:hypothetical protein